MFTPFWLVAFVHLLLAVSSTGTYQALNTIPDEQFAIWKSLCDNTAPLLLKQSSQIKALAETLDTNLDPTNAIFDCFNRVAPALFVLNQLIQENKHDVCSLVAVEGIIAYFDIYVSRHQYRSEEERLPEALKNFFLGYGLQVSKTCKKNLIPTLEESYKQMIESEPLVGEDFGEKFREYSNLFSAQLTEDSLIGKLIKTPIDYDDLLLPRDIYELVREEYGIEDKDDENEDDEENDDYDRIFMQTKSSDSVRVFKAICEKRYKSIYKQLLPSLYLSNIGFNYQGDELKYELDELRSNQLVRQTYRMTFLCESLENIVLVEDPKFAEANKNLQSRAMMRILSPEEAKKLLRETARQNNDGDDRHKETRELIGAIKEFVYAEPDYEVQIEDEILNDQDEDLMKMVRSFEVNKSQLDRIRSRFFNKLKRSLISDLWQGKLSAVVDKFADMKAHNYLSAETSLDGKQLIEAIDKNVDEVYNQEESVSWRSTATGLTRGMYWSVSNAVRGGAFQRSWVRTKKKIRRGKLFWRVFIIVFFIIAVLCLHTVLG